MADLSVVVYGRAGSKSQLQDAGASALSQSLSEALHAVETITQSALVSSLTVNVSEALHLAANVVTVTQEGNGDVSFFASPDHASVTNYTLRLRVSGSSTVVDTDDLGVPTPDGNNVIVVSEVSFFAGQSAGNYTVSILVTSAGGSTDSGESNAFTLPLP